MLPSTYNRTSEKLILSYLFFLACFILVFQNLITGWFSLFAAQVIAAVLLGGIIKLQSSRPGNSLLQTVRNWIPLPYVLFGYKMIHYLINDGRNPRLHGDQRPMADRRRPVSLWNRSHRLAPADHRPLADRADADRLRHQLLSPFDPGADLISEKGADPLPEVGDRSGPWLHPLLSRLLHRPGHRPDFYHPYQVPLDGIWIRESLARWNYSLDACPRDCFPSGHTEIPLITLWLAFRYRREAVLHLPADRHPPDLLHRLPALPLRHRRHRRDRPGRDRDPAGTGDGEETGEKFPKTDNIIRSGSSGVTQ